MESYKNRFNTYFKSNRVIQILTCSDILIWGGYYMYNALAAVYLDDKIAQNPLQTIAFGYSIYLLSRSIFQMPVARYLDYHKGYIDEAYIIGLSGFVTGLSAISFIFITEAWHLYLVQIVFGFGIALNLPAWRKTFAKFVDKGHEGAEYGLYDVVNNIGTALLITIGGYIVTKIGSFELLFIAGGILMMLGGFISFVLLRLGKIQRARS